MERKEKQKGHGQTCFGAYDEGYYKNLLYRQLAQDYCCSLEQVKNEKNQYTYNCPFNFKIDLISVLEFGI